jgi:hypothetical protein
MKSQGPASVDALATSARLVYAGGDFSEIGGKERDALAALRATDGRATAWNPDPNDPVHALALAAGRLYVGGGFWHIAGFAASGFAAFAVR